MTTTAAFCPLSTQLMLDANLGVIAGGQIFAYDAGTTNPRPAYADAGLTTALPTPILADAFGRIPVMFFDVGSYKLVLQDDSGVQLSVIDGIPGGVSSGSGTTPVGTTIPTAFVMPAHTDDVVDGWLPLNGQTIGSAVSGASSRANADVQNLFLKLWNKDTSLTVQGGRGVSASADWGANKTITLPDYRGRTVSGVDGMGTALAGVLTSLSSGTSANVIGAKVGAEGVSLTNAQNGPHSHNITVNAGGAVTPTGTTDTQGSHQHGGSTAAVGDHVHSYLQAFATTGLNSGTSGTAFNGNSANSTVPAGGHSHTIATDIQGAHAHNLVMPPLPTHTHAATSDQQGTGAAHPSVQPTILTYWHIKI